MVRGRTRRNSFHNRRTGRRVLYVTLFINDVSYLYIASIVHHARLQYVLLYGGIIPGTASLGVKGTTEDFLF